MKLVLGALCMIALFPAATSASKIQATDDSVKSQCLQRAAVAWAADYAHQALLNNLASERMGATGNVSFGSAGFSRPVDSRIRPSVAASYCGALKEAQRAIAPSTITPRRARVERGGAIWKAK